MNNDPLSLYIHVPFCTRKCGYCHFYSIVNNPDHRELYIEALIKEIELRQSLFNDRKILSLYFGGGTPTLLTTAEIEKILSHLPPLNADMEVTIEANPESITSGQLNELVTIGFNRISFGVQSFDDALLKTLTRPHTALRAEEAIHEAYVAGIQNISIDLMMDLPYQKASNFEASLKKAISLPLSHLSLYNLVFEPNTPFYRKKSSLLPHLPNEEESLHFLERCSLLREAGFSRYEISAWEKNGHRSLHNLGYWTGREYLGLGPSAHSFIGDLRWANPSNLFFYHQELLAGHRLEISDPLSMSARKRELLAIRLRYLSAFDLAEYNPDEESRQNIEALIEKGLIEKVGEKIVLSERGTLFYDTVAEMIV